MTACANLDLLETGRLAQVSIYCLCNKIASSVGSHGIIPGY